MRYILIIIISLISCTTKKDIRRIHTNGQMVIVDSSEATESLWQYNPKERSGYYPIYYIGKTVDTIYIGKRKIQGLNHEQKDYSTYSNFTWPDSNKMEITIDTSFSLTNYSYYSHFTNNGEKEHIDSIKTNLCLAIFIRNNCDSLLSIGSFSELGHTLRQAKNESGNWIDIETPIQYFCGTNARELVLEPDEMLLAMLPRYKGDFKTECRLKFEYWQHTVYSNVYYDWIDRKQLTDSFISPF